MVAEALERIGDLAVNISERAIDVAEAMLRVAREVHDGNFVGRTYSFDLGSGVLDLTLSDDLDPDVRAAASQRLEAARAEVTAGLVEFDHLGL